MAYIIVNIIFAILFLFLGVDSVLAVSFSISNPQQDGEEVSIDVSLSGLTSNSCLNNYCYLQAAFTSPSPIKYFGFTKNHNGQWYEYISSPSTSYIQSNFFSFQPTNGAWSGKLFLKINTQSSNYHGSGTYNIKAWRYSGNSSSAAGNSDSIAINLQSPTPSPSPTISPAPSSSPISSNSPSSTFTISNVPTQINSDESFKVLVNLSLPNNLDTPYYLTGAFKIKDGTRYFGLTNIGSDWVKYSSENFSSQYKITTNNSGSWTGNLEIKPDTDDSDYKGTGDYIFKVGRYTSSGSGPTWSNEVTIKINSNNSSDQGGVTTTITSSNTITSSPTPLAVNSNKSSSIVQLKTSKDLSSKTASVAGEATKGATPSHEPQAEVKAQRQINFPLVVGIILVLSGFTSLILIYLRRKNT